MKALLLTQKQFDAIKEIALFTGSRAFATRSFIFNKKRINKLFPTVKEKREKHLFFQKIKNEYLNEVTQRGK